nr:MAG TPA: hypothetical protein [Caudoviricetes sp.]
MIYLKDWILYLLLMETLRISLDSYSSLNRLFTITLIRY